MFRTSKTCHCWQTSYVKFGSTRYRQSDVDDRRLAHRRWWSMTDWGASECVYVVIFESVCWKAISNESRTYLRRTDFGIVFDVSITEAITDLFNLASLLFGWKRAPVARKLNEGDLVDPTDRFVSKEVIERVLVQMASHTPVLGIAPDNRIIVPAVCHHAATVLLLLNVRVACSYSYYRAFQCIARSARSISTRLTLTS